MKTIAELRKEQYEYHYRLYPYLSKWKKNPYTWIKARFYMETSALLVYFLLKTKIKPNTVTIIYGLLGLAGGILLAISTKVAIIIAVSIFFLKGILDWSDGHYARITKQTSITGYILDRFGTQMGWISLWSGMGIYIANKSDMSIFYYLAPIIPTIFALDIILHSKNALFSNYLTKDKIKNMQIRKEELKIDETAKSKDLVSRTKKIYDMINKIFTPRARFVDSVCLILLIETFTGIFILHYLFMIFLLWIILSFIAKFYFVAKGGWVEEELQTKIKNLFG